MEVGLREAYAYWLEENYDIQYEDLNQHSPTEVERLFAEFQAYLKKQ